MTEYTKRILAEYDEACRNMRRELKDFLAEKGPDLEESDGGSLWGAKREQSQDPPSAFILFAWGVGAEDVCASFTNEDNSSGTGHIQ